MSERERYDVLIIGAGQAGVPLVHALAAASRRVALAERARVGGSCVNFGCTPTKAALASARLAYEARRAATFGVRIPTVDVDFAAVLERARAIAEESRIGIERRFAGQDNPTLLRGQGRFTGRDGADFALRVGERDVRAGAVVLDTGMRSSVPPIEGLDRVPWLHAGNWLDHPERPRHLLMLGGGVIALEMSQFYARMGSEVTLIERGPRLAKNEDEDVAISIQSQFASEGIALRLNATTRRVDRDDDGIRVTLSSGGAAEELRGSHLFVATGRTPNTGDLGLETIGLELGPGGIVPVDERLATSVTGVWAAGDIRGGPQFTHTSWDDYRILKSQLLGDGVRTTRRIVPYAIFTDPELGRVGMTEGEAKRTGTAHEVMRFDMSRNGRARQSGGTAGFIKVLVEPGTGRILGACVLASQGAELVHLYVDLMNAGAPASVIRDAVHIHPTLSEAIQSAVTPHP
jgi:pyruvate/2-oxoglutarate dehydrogenase complex dihydrolipoamide dehydrogenase (E3) component